MHIHVQRHKRLHIQAVRYMYSLKNQASGCVRIDNKKTIRAHHTVDYDPFIKSQVASSNQVEGLMRCKFGHVALILGGNETLEVHHVIRRAVVPHEPPGPCPSLRQSKSPSIHHKAVTRLQPCTPYSILVPTMP